MRERIDDIPLLVQTLLPKISRRVGKKTTGIEAEALAKLEQYRWSGNIRELENVLEKAITLCEGELVKAGDICLSLLPSLESESIMPLEELEQLVINRALEKYGTSLAGKRETARALGISLTTLYNKLRKAGKFQKL